MRFSSGAVAVMVAFAGCQQCGAGMPDAGEAGGGGGGEETGGGGGGGGRGIDSDAGPLLIGCEVDAGTSATPECSPATSGCQSATDCVTGLCLKLATGGVCTNACGDGGGCEPGWSCQRRWTGVGEDGFCVPTRRTP